MIKKIAVTGTKGKSTVLRLLEAGFRSLSYNVYGTFGVDGYFYNGHMVRDGSDCSGYLDIDSAQYPTDVHLIEATSFTLDKNFFDDIEIDCAIFTSFDETEHTEIHQEEGSYLKSKKKIFSLLKKGKKAIVCRDIPNFSQIVSGFEQEIITYGFHPESDYNLAINMINKKKMIFSMKYGENTLFFKTNLLGDFNCKNMAAAYIACLEMNLNNVPFFRSLESFKGFDGRFERYQIPKTNTDVIIDYAHTHESLDALLKLVKEIYPEKDLITIFGCGGDKSKSKRPLMASAAEKHSDFVIITNDNPRSENPADIVSDIVKGFKSDNYAILLDRGESIKSCLSKSNNCVLVIAGKGAEDHIMFGETTLFHSDKESLVSWCVQNNLSLFKSGEETPHE